MGTLNFKSFDADPAEQKNIIYVPIFEIFDRDDRLTSLTEHEKKAYSLFRSRLSQSYHHPNQYRDSQGRYFIKYSNAELAFMLGQRNEGTAKKAKDTLRKIGLIEYEDRSRIIYVNDVYTLPDQDAHRIAKPTFDDIQEAKKKASKTAIKLQETSNKTTSVTSSSEEHQKMTGSESANYFFSHSESQKMTSSNSTPSSTISLFAKLLRGKTTQDKKESIIEYLESNQKTLNENDKFIIENIVKDRTQNYQLESLALILEDNLYRQNYSMSAVNDQIRFIERSGGTPDQVRLTIIKNKLRNVENKLRYREAPKYHLNQEQTRDFVQDRLSHTVEKYIINAVNHIQAVSDCVKAAAELEFYTIQQPNIFWYLPNDIQIAIFPYLSKTTVDIIRGSRFQCLTTKNLRKIVQSSGEIWATNALYLKNLMGRRLDIDCYDEVMSYSTNAYVELIAQAYEVLMLEEAEVTVYEIFNRIRLYEKMYGQGLFLEDATPIIEAEKKRINRIVKINRPKDSKKRECWEEIPYMENEYTKEHLAKKEEESNEYLDKLLADG